MSSSFKGLDLFGSGPHRFSVGPRGQLITANFFNGGGDAGSTLQGLIAWQVVVKGRLVAASEAALNALREAVLAQLEATPTPGDLVDTHGRTWSGMSFVTFQEGDRVDRGRVWSVSYTATFLHL
ncbi:MAG: hypothetical protein GC200_08390 [Tepidisphaera sp.]|nr:hypothetical protein [Tepidisphaera sp.]